MLAISGKYRGASHAEGTLTLTIDTLLDDQDAIDAMTIYLRTVAERSGARHDGWGSMVVR